MGNTEEQRTVIANTYERAVEELKISRAVLEDVKNARELNESNVPPEKLLYDEESKPIVYLTEGKPTVVGSLKDGRVLFAAATRDGSRAVDKFGQPGVIDPQTNEVRFKHTPQRYHGPGAVNPRWDSGDVQISVGGTLGQVSSPTAVPFDLTDIPKQALAAIALKDPSEIAFAMAVTPVFGLYDKKREPAKVSFKKKLILFIAAVIAVFKKVFSKPVVTVKNDHILQVQELDVPLAHPKRIYSTIYEIPGSNTIAVCRYAGIRVPLEPDGTVAKTYLDRWGNFLNYLAANGIWKYGILAPPSTLSLGHGVREGLRFEKILYTFLFTDQIPEDKLGPAAAAAALNQRVGAEVFFQEGEVSNNCDWSKFPW